MRRVLDTSPGIEQTAWYGLEASLEDVESFLKMSATRSQWPNFIVFPGPVGSYRVDFLVAARRPFSPALSLSHLRPGSRRRGLPQRDP